MATQVHPNSASKLFVSARRELLPSSSRQHDGAQDGRGAAKVPDALALYLNDIGRTPLLTSDAELELAQRIEAGDAEALQRLVRSNLRLVVSIAKRYANQGVPLLDLIQEGNCGLLRAATRYDWRVGARFATYASWWIRQAITQALTSQSRSIRLPARMSETVRLIKRTIRDLTQDLGRAPELVELSDALGMSQRRVTFALQVAQHVMSLDAKTSEESESDLGDAVPDAMPGPEDQVIDDLLRVELEQAVLDLPGEQYRVLTLRFGLGGEVHHSLAEVGARLGISREGARRIERQAILNLRQRLGDAAALEGPPQAVLRRRPAERISR